MTDYDDIMKAIIDGDIQLLEEYSLMIDDFPKGKDHFIQRNWITNAVDCGTYDVIKWMIDKGVSLIFEDEEGYSILHSAIDSNNHDKYSVLNLLIESGADINAYGINDWTPAHMAAARNDTESLKILIRHGADLSIRTRIDDYATPLEEAQMLKCNQDIIDLLT